MKFEEIDVTTIEGRTLVRAIGFICTLGTCIDKTPQEILDKLLALDKGVE